MPLIRNAAYNIAERIANVLPLADATVVYQHAALGLSSGRVRPLQSGDTFAGFAGRRVDSRALATGAPPEQVPIIRSGEVLLPVSATVGASVYATADDTFSTAGGSYIGKVVRLEGSGAWVAFEAQSGSAVSGDGNSARARLTAAAAGRASVRRFMVWGDSTANQNAQNTTGTTRQFLGNAWAQLGIRMARNCVDMVAVGGNSGFRTDQIIPTFAAQVAANTPDFVLLSVPTNDIIQGYGAAYALRGVLQMAALVESIGAVPIVRTLSPGETFAANADYRQARRDFNAAITEAATANGWPLFDTSLAFIDPASSVDAPLAGYTDGSVHPANKGSVTEAEILADVLRGLPRRNLFNPLATGNIISNPLMTGTGGTKPAGVTGDVPDGGNYTIGGGATCVSSLVARTDGGPGFWWQSDLVIPAGGYATMVLPVASMATAGIAVGDVLRLVGDVEVLDGHTGGLYGVDVRGRFIGATDPQWVNSYAAATASGTLRPGRWAAQNRVPELAVPSGTTSIGAYLNILTSGAASCTVRVGAASGGKV